MNALILAIPPALIHDPSVVLEPVVMPVITALSALVPSVTKATRYQNAAFLLTAVKSDTRIITRRYIHS